MNKLLYTTSDVKYIFSMFTTPKFDKWFGVYPSRISSLYHHDINHNLLTCENVLCIPILNMLAVNLGALAQDV